MDYTQSAELKRKLGLKPVQNAFALHAPIGYARTISIPKVAKDVEDLSEELDWIQAFYTDKVSLLREIETLKNRLAKGGQLWVSWPKKSSGVSTTLNGNLVREIGLTAGLVDIKIAAINDTWSALKFVYRRRDRQVT